MNLEKIKQKINEAFLASEDNTFGLEDSLIMLCRVGSVAQNTDLAHGEGAVSGDLDIRGLVIPPSAHVLGLDSWKGWRWECPEEDGNPALDVEIWPIDKFMDLALKGNPTILEWMWLRDEDYLYKTIPWDVIKNSRNVFSSKQASHKFLGMARSQLLKLNSSGTNKHVQEHEFKQIQAKLEEWEVPIEEVLQGKFEPQVQTNFGKTWAEEQVTRIKDMIAKYKQIYKEREAQDPAKVKASTAYMGIKRKTVVTKHGWDVKNGMHLLRVLLMGEEFLRTGNLRVFRDSDGDMLRSVKKGEYSLDEVKTMAERLFSGIQTALEGSSLPDAADRAKANKLLEGIYREAYTLTSVRSAAPIRADATRKI